MKSETSKTLATNMLNNKSEIRWWAQIVLILLSCFAPGPARSGLSFAIMVMALGTLPDWQVVKARKLHSIALYFGSILMFGGSLLYNAYEIFFIAKA